MLRAFPYSLSQYFWLCILSLLFLSIISYNLPITTKDFFSYSTDGIWNSSKMPYWMLHTADLRLSSLNPETYTNAYNRLNTAITKLQPYYIMISGDFTENSHSKSSKMSHSEMVPNDWQLYDKLMDSLNLTNSDRLIQVAGNHDLFNIKSFDSPNHYANHRLYNSTTFHFRKYQFEPDPSAITIIATNPYQFPVLPNELNQWAFPSDSYRKELTNLLSKDESHYTIVVSHFPVMRWYPTYATTSGVKMDEILVQSNNVRFFLSGQLSKDHPQFMHHGDSLEVIASSLSRCNNVGLLTFDNHRAAYHDIDLTKEPFGAITSPVPIKQVSGLDDFFETETSTNELRVLLFTNETDVNLTASGAVTGQLECQTIQNGVQLCSLSIPKLRTATIHHIDVTGYWSGSVDFTIANTAIGFAETPYSDDANVAWIILFLVFYVFTFVMTLPVDFVNIGDSFNRWVIGRSDSQAYLFALFGGFLAVKTHSQRANKLIKYSLFFVTIWILGLPICFFSIDGQISVLWVWGYISGGENIFMFYGMRIAVQFMIFVIIPILLYLSAVDSTRGIEKIFSLDTAIYIAFAAGWFYTLALLVQWFGFTYALTSPLVFFIPIYLHAITIIHSVNTIKIEKNNYLAENAIDPRLPFSAL